jgi:hypothetical protein
MGTVVCLSPRYSLRRIDLILHLRNMGMSFTEAERAAAKEDRLYSVIAYRCGCQTKEHSIVPRQHPLSRRWSNFSSRWQASPTSHLRLNFSGRRTD